MKNLDGITVLSKGNFRQVSPWQYFKARVRMVVRIWKATAELHLVKGDSLELVYKLDVK